MKITNYKSHINSNLSSADPVRADDRPPPRQHDHPPRMVALEMDLSGNSFVNSVSGAVVILESSMFTDLD